ncbi:MAG: CRISPR-associated helicase Cas3' [Clostridiales bacterium]|nr:CRISPR-associated helicase Cas3' [Eubacteriales bacterium]MDH7567309.1 CRISPR-associated helicase Cas3' [Clostridiales bacterium]
MYYGKPLQGSDGEYKTHVGLCYRIAQEELEYIRPVLSEILTEEGEDPEEFFQEMLNSVLLHDFGKLNPLFQQLMENELKKHAANKSLYFRHEVLSSLVMMSLYRERLFKGIPFGLLAVLGHHKSLDENLRKFDRENNWPEKDWPVITDEAVDYAIMVFRRLSGMNLDRSVFKRLNKIAYVNLRKFISGQMNFTYFQSRGAKKTRKLYSLMKGFLHYCDWLASSSMEYYRTCRIDAVTKDSLVESLKRKLEKDHRSYEERRFHTDCASVKGDLVVIAPTGSGKTEAALFWALNAQRKKILFLMPTRITSNSLYERMAQLYFSQSACGLVHSGAELYFETEGKKQEEEKEDNPAKYMLQKAFIPAVMVSTVDQILTSGFNVGAWTQKEFALLGSSVVFDEIQAYDTFTLGLITSMIQKIKALKGRVMIMSATMPSFLRNHFLKLLELKNSVIAEERMNLARNRWLYEDTDVEGIREKVLHAIEAGKKVALIVNNIDTAKAQYLFYKKKGISVMCLHSEFMAKDRKEKEESLIHGGEQVQLVIATQVIEVSLDVSFDMVFSEGAPMECLIQRAGRCNRYGLLEYGDFIVFNPSQIALDYVYKNSRDIIYKTIEAIRNKQRLLTERDISDLLDQVYEGFNMYDKKYEEALGIFSEVTSKYCIYDCDMEEGKFSTRLGGISRVSLIPAVFQAEVEELVANKKYKSVGLYEVPVSYGKYYNHIRSKYKENKYGLPIYEFCYDRDMGITDVTCYLYD